MNLKTLQSIVNITRSRFKESSQTSTNHVLPPYSFTIPPVPDISQRLYVGGISEPLATSLCQVFEAHASQLQQHLKKSILQLSQQLPQSERRCHTLNEFVRVQTASFEEKLEKWIVQIIDLGKKKMTNASANRRQVLFNHDYVPMLEKYFEHNAYPSACDRLTLAKKSGMTPRQIEVWFQNHRNRAKKEGRQLRRLNPSGIVLSSLVPPRINQQQIPVSIITFALFQFLIRPSVNRCIHPELCVSLTAHTLSPIVWPRTQSQRRKHPEPVSIDELSHAFATKLNFRGTPNHKRVSKSHSDSPRPETSSPLPLPLSVPHPALINPSFVLRSKVRCSRRAFSPVSCVPAFPTPSPSAKPYTFCSVLQTLHASRNGVYQSRLIHASKPSDNFHASRTPLPSYSAKPSQYRPRLYSSDLPDLSFCLAPKDFLPLTHVAISPQAAPIGA
uniref:HD2 mating type protein n=1 Tax=Volvariella volvacea TaxID=36659 RepID=A0A0D3ML66_9AGAR|nr:HD2 mating type protein [Volvariella volvacea]